jgi:hypothetical protein
MANPGISGIILLHECEAGNGHGGGQAGTMMSEPSLTDPVKRRLILAGLLLAVCVLAGWAVSRWFAAPTSTTVVAPPSTLQAKDAKAADPDERFRRLVLGTWEDNYEGKRTMTLKVDGAGTMLVELSGLKATLFADRLRFDMKWTVESGQLKKQTIGGEPTGKVQAILKIMGDRVDEPILELTQDRLLLLDKDGKTKYDWRRVRPKGA